MEKDYECEKKSGVTSGGRVHSEGKKKGKGTSKPNPTTQKRKNFVGVETRGPEKKRVTKPGLNGALYKRG